MSRKRKAVEPPTAKPQIFEGCRFVFCSRSTFMDTMKCRIQEHGGVVEDSLTARTTHLVATQDAVGDVARQMAHCPADRPRCTLVLSSGQELQVPQGLLVVTSDFCSHSMLGRERKAEAAYLPPALQPALVGLQPAGAGPPCPTGEAAAAAAAAVLSEPPDAAVAVAWPPAPAQRRAPSSADSTVTIPFTTEELAAAAAEDDASSTGPQVAAAAAAAPPPPPPPPPPILSQPENRGLGREAAGPAQEEAGPGEQPGGHSSCWEQCVVQRQGAEFVCKRGVKPRFTGGSTGIPWGFAGVWDEPSDVAAARDTLDKLRRAWYNSKGGAEGAGGSAAACGHIACYRRRRDFCLLEKLDEFKRVVYFEKGERHKIKALEKAQLELAQHGRALIEAADVDEVGLAPGAAEKVRELVRFGYNQRVVDLQRNKGHQVLALFQEVWGSGLDTARRWYAAGCRTLDDLRARPDLLSVQSKVWLRYCDDLQQKIPRATVAQVEKIARRAIFELVESLGAPDVERTFACACGSYRRGAAESNDIDILACLPPSLVGYDVAGFLSRLLRKLLADGLLLDELGPLQHRDPNTERASFMGLCRPPGSACVRRIDFKCYGHAQTATALTFFGSGTRFNRALRFWANTMAAEAARRFNPEANGFKLNDTYMVPRLLLRENNCTVVDQPLEPAVAVTCESDIFHALGLAYVPPHMRMFNTG